MFAPKTGAFYVEPKIGAMKNIRLSVHAPESQWLRQLLTERRVALGLSQRALAERLDVVYSFVGKVETGDRRLDVFEFMAYCEALDMLPEYVLQRFRTEFPSVTIPGPQSN